MKLIKPSVEIWEQEPGLDGIYKAIERAGRICYRSENNTTEDSAKPFVDRMVKSGHFSVLEHGTVYLRIVQCISPYYKQFLSEYNLKESDLSIPNSTNVQCAKNYYWKYSQNPYSVAISEGIPGIDVYDITTNLRVLVENNWLDDLKYLCEPTEFHEKRVCVHFICDIGVWNEFIRHRTLSRNDDTEIIYLDDERKFSFAQESTRYCNYSKDKFGNELTFIIPCWMDTIKEGAVYSYDTDIELWQRSEDANTSNFLQSIAWAEKNYLTLLHNGWTPQQARAVLPKALKTELVMTGFIDDWKHFLMLRSNKYGKGGAHPSADELATPLYEEFVARGYINKN